MHAVHRVNDVTGLQVEELRLTVCRMAS